MVLLLDPSKTTISSLRIDESAHSGDEPKFEVFFSMLVSLFSMFCFNCHHPSPGVTVKRCGTMATVIQTCDLCGPNKSFYWKSQPFILGRHPAGNVMLSFSILMAGVNITKVLLMFRHMKLSCISARTYFSHQNRFLFPAILQHWEWYRCGLISRLKGVKEALTWCGDGQFNSMGHSVKYGVYTMYCENISKIVHFELLQIHVSLLNYFLG